MRLRYLLLIPLAAVLLFFAARLALPVSAEGAINRGFNVAAFLVAAAGCLAAAQSFQPGDYLRTAWHTQAASSLLLATSSVLRGLEPAETMLMARTPLVFMANLLTIFGAVIFARTHRVAGLELPWSRDARRAFIGGMVIAAFLATGPSIVVRIPEALGGDHTSWMQIFSSLGDFIFLVLIAPIFMTALALRGGLLTWPWAFLTASTAAWLVYDAQDSVAYLFPHLETLDRTIVTVPLRVLACTCLFAAAMAQRRITIGAIDRSGHT
jgi:hypothetical protein